MERTAYFKWHLALYAFDETDDYLYARKDWLNDFLENKTLRPGKDFRVYEYGKPGLVLLLKTHLLFFKWNAVNILKKSLELGPKLYSNISQTKTLLL